LIWQNPLLWPDAADKSNFSSTRPMNRTQVPETTSAIPNCNTLNPLALQVYHVSFPSLGQ
jgi:hypothetical protein